MENNKEFVRALSTLIDFVGEKPVAINYKYKTIDFENVSYFLYNEKRSI